MTTNCSMLVFAYHEVGYRCLELLLERKEQILAVFTHEDAAGERIWFRPVAELARAHGIPVYTPSSIKGPVVEQIRALAPDIIFSFYYRYMIPGDVLRIPRLGAFNMHGSLLPRYRGRVPINWAIIHGETETGATLHHMVRRADAGDIVDQQAVAIGREDTAQDVFFKVTEAAVQVLDRNLAALKTGRAPRHAQDEAQATTFGGRRPEDGRIDWSWSSQRIFDFVRALTEPYPGAFTTTRGRTLLIWWGVPVERPAADQAQAGAILSTRPLIVATGDGAFQIGRAQWAHGRAVEGDEFVRFEVLGA
ncbi:MAG: formyltransferase [Gammaproteobacteria bacterium]|nr:formyltransferase [Gammaproteobacteria bacterium]